MIKAWYWQKSLAEVTFSGGEIWHLHDGRGRDRATIWQNATDRFTWHTWDEDGTGGENGPAKSLDDAKLFCLACIVRQGWAPSGWKVHW
jgi:hypothetical protein